MVIIAEVVPKAGESIDSVLRRFKRKVENSGVGNDIKRHEAFTKPSVARKLKSAEARKRDHKRQQLADKFFKSNANFKFSKDKTTKLYAQDQPKYNNNGRPYQNRDNRNSGGEAQRPYQQRDQRPYQNQRPQQQYQNRGEQQQPRQYQNREQGNYQNRGEQQQPRQDTRPQQSGYSNNPKRK
jgi:small subunit ribosomal protein S21